MSGWSRSHCLPLPQTVPKIPLTLSHHLCFSKWLTLRDLPLSLSDYHWPPCLYFYLFIWHLSIIYLSPIYLSIINLSMPFYLPLCLLMSTCICLWCHSSVFLLIYLCVYLSTSSVTITLFIHLLPIYHLSTYLSCLPLYLSTSIVICLSSICHSIY